MDIHKLCGHFIRKKGQKIVISSQVGQIEGDSQKICTKDIGQNLSKY